MYAANRAKPATDRFRLGRLYYKCAPAFDPSFPGARFETIFYTLCLPNESSPSIAGRGTLLGELHPMGVLNAGQQVQYGLLGTFDVSLARMELYFLF